ncbi:MAG: hypothetical protein P4L74_04840 [Candidatus Doudnabacteria bacterium]|nr:hypothetical protein [Candidatus Doudnabacteria bacterium]
MYAKKIKFAIETVLKENQITAVDLVVALRGNTSEKTASEYQFGGINHYPEMRNIPGEVARLNLIDFIKKYFNTKS